MAPRLTVFTTFGKNIDYLDETIASVLSQSFRDFEYLMINDGPRENADALLARHPDSRIRLITPPAPLGIRGARDAGLREARGELIAFIDSDDLCEPGRFEKQVAFLDTHPEHVVVGSALRYIDEHSRTVGKRTYAETDEEIKRAIVVANCIAQPAVMARRAALIEAGGYTSEFEWAEDYDLWLRTSRLGKFHNLQETLTAYRVHSAAGKNLRLRPALRDSLRLKIHAVRHYGFPLTLPVAMSIAAHAVLMLLPSRFTFWLFRKVMVR